MNARKIAVISPIKPIEAVKAGEKYTWKYGMQCRNGKILPAGSFAKVIEETGMIPFDEVMDRGYNLLIETVHGTSVWATFEQCLSRGLLVKKD